jgi:uncharacterized protein (TIGR03437 family)
VYPRIPIITLLLVCQAVWAQSYRISTIAGGQPVPLQRIAVDAQGNLYLTVRNDVFRLDPRGNLAHIAGNSRADYSGDGGPAVNAQLNQPRGIAVDAAGNLYVADMINSRVRKITPEGIITTLAAAGSHPCSVAVDGNGNVYVVNYYSKTIQKITPGGALTTIAGPEAKLGLSYDTAGIVVDDSGNVYVSDATSPVIRKITPQGVITTVAGNLITGYAGDGGPAVNAEFSEPAGLALDSLGNLLIRDAGNCRIRKIGPNGIITTIAGNGTCGNSGDGGPATAAHIGFGASVALDTAGAIYFDSATGDGGSSIRKISPDGTVSSVSGGDFSYSPGDGGPSVNAHLQLPNAVALDPAGNLYIADTSADRVRKIAPNGVITTFAGNGQYCNSSPPSCGDGGLATAAAVSTPYAVGVDAAGNVYILEGFQVRKVNPSGIISTFANFYPILAGFMTVDAAGTVYIALRNAVYQLSPGGVPIPVAPQTKFINVGGLAVDGAGNLYIADFQTYLVQKVAADGTVTTVAGNGKNNHSGDGGPALTTSVGAPFGLAIAADGTLFVSTDGVFIRKIAPDGNMTTIAGNGYEGFSGDGGSATLAMLDSPGGGIAIDQAGNLYLADVLNHAVRKLQPGGSAPVIGAVTNAASNLAGPVAPGEIVVLYGEGLGPPQLTSGGAAGTVVSFNGSPASVIYAWAAQAAAVVPSSIAGGAVQVTVAFQGQTSAAFSVAVAAAAPGLFTLDATGTGQAAAITSDGAVNGPSTPAAAGSVIRLFATGAGQQPPAVSVAMGGKPAQVLATAQVAGFGPGLMQLDVRIPADSPAGDAVPVTLQVGETASQPGVTIAVR